MRRALWIAGLAAAAGVALAALAPDADEPAREDSRAPATRTLPLRPLTPADARVIRDPAHALRAPLPPRWRRVRRNLTPLLAPVTGTILAVSTFRPDGHRCGPAAPDLPDTAIPARGALLLVSEDRDAQPGTLPARPRRLALTEGVRWPCLDRPGIVGFHTWFRAHGRLLYVTGIAGERTDRRRRRELLGVAESIRFGPTPQVEVGVRPWVGGPDMRVGLSLVATHRSGATGGRRVRWYSAAVRGPTGVGCVIENHTRFSAGPPGHRLRAVLDPQRTKGSHWCRGRFRGVVRYSDGVCRNDGRCSRLYVRRAGRFGFTVR